MPTDALGLTLRRHIENANANVMETLEFSGGLQDKSPVARDILRGATAHLSMLGVLMLLEIWGSSLNWLTLALESVDTLSTFRNNTPPQAL